MTVQSYGHVTPARSTRRVSLWAFRAAVVLLSLLLPLLLLEVVLRTVGPILPGNYNTGTFLTTHPLYARFHVPGFDGWVKTSEFTSRVSINTLGLRGPEREYARPPGVRRILVLGDSFVEAAQVAEADGVVGRLEASLNRRGAERYEVLNGGVGGWGTGQQLLFLRNEGYRYEPDVVIVMLFLGNDIYDNSWVLQGRPKNPREPYFVVQDDGSFEPMAFRDREPEESPPLIDALRQHTLLWHVFETGVLAKLGEDADDAELRANRPNLNKIIIHQTKGSDRQDDAWRTTLMLLQRIGQFNAERSIPTVVAIVPAAYQVYNDEWTDLLRMNKARGDDWSQTHPNDVLAVNAGMVGVPMLDLLPALRSGASGGERLYFPKDKHWTEAGHAIAARAIEEYLGEHGLVP